MVSADKLTYDERLEALRKTKLEQTAAKRALGTRDRDDHGDVLPPEGFAFEPPWDGMDPAFFSLAVRYLL